MKASTAEGKWSSGTEEKIPALASLLFDPWLIRPHVLKLVDWHPEYNGMRRRTTLTFREGVDSVWDCCTHVRI